MHLSCFLGDTSKPVRVVISPGVTVDGMPPVAVVVINFPAAVSRAAMLNIMAHVTVLTAASVSGNIPMTRPSVASFWWPPVPDLFPETVSVGGPSICVPPKRLLPAGLSLPVCRCFIMVLMTAVPGPCFQVA